DTLYQLTSANYAYKGLKLDGSGIKIGLIDSGVDYTHPALGGCFGKGCKIAYGYDLVGNDFDGTIKSIQPSEDPIDNCPLNSSSATGHGTFLAGIIAANDKEYNWTGVAPGVTLGMWKVYGCNFPTVPNDILIKAIEMAYKAGMDIINLSLGLHGGWQEEILAEVANRVVKKGVHIIAANGNIGANGIFLSASPASGKNVIAVGSVMNRHVPGYLFEVFSKENVSTTIPYRTFTNTPFRLEERLPIVTSTQLSKTNNACKPIKRKPIKSILLIRQGDCDPLDQINHAKQAGAKAVIFYSNSQGTAQVTVLINATLPVAFIRSSDAKIKAHSTGQFTNILTALDTPLQETMHAVSGFSSQGPTNELQLKPELMGLGGNVFSTLPCYQKSYGFRSGTSLASPYVAGQVALILQKKLVPPIPKSPYGDSPIRQGAGVINITQALEGFEILQATPSYLALNDSAHFKQQKITFKNHFDKDIILTLSHQPSLTAKGYQNQVALEPVLLGPQVATVEFSLNQLSIPAGQSAQVSIRLLAPNVTHSLWGGYITARTDRLTLSIPYLGMTGRMKDLTVLDRSGYPKIGLADGHSILGLNQTGEFKAPKGPYLLVRLLTGTRFLQIQIKQGSRIVGDMPLEGMPRHWLMRNTLGFTEYSNAYYSWQWTGDYLPRDATFDQTSHDPKRVHPGKYHLVVRALKVFGDMKNKKDWEEWTSPELVMK
ncbi:hypothetical protein CU098_000826, partial [Rhizopus stolonifer]